MSIQTLSMEQSALRVKIPYKVALSYMQHQDHDEYRNALILLADARTQSEGLTKLKAISLHNNPHHLALLELGKQYLGTDNKQEAKEWFAKCEHPEAKMCLAKLLFDEGKIQQVQNVVQQANGPYYFSTKLGSERYYFLQGPNFLSAWKQEQEDKEKKAKALLAELLQKAQVYSKRISKQTQSISALLAFSLFQQDKADEALKHVDAFINYLIGSKKIIEDPIVASHAKNVLQRLKKMAHKNAEASFLLSQIYRNGIGVNVDQIEAGRYLRDAARCGAVRAQFELACQKQPLDLEKLFEVIQCAKNSRKEYEQKIYQQAKQKLIDQSSAEAAYLLFMHEANCNEVKSALAYLNNAEQTREMNSVIQVGASKKQQALESRVVRVLETLSQRSKHALNSFGDFWLLRAQNNKDKEAIRKAFNATKKLLDVNESDENAEKLKKEGLKRLEALVDLESRQALAELLTIYASGAYGIAPSQEKLIQLVPFLTDSILEAFDQVTLKVLMDFTQKQDDIEFRYNVASRLFAAQSVSAQIQTQAEKLLDALIEQRHEKAINCFFSVLSQRPENHAKLVSLFERICKLNQQGSLNNVICAAVAQMERIAERDCQVGRFVASLYQTGISEVLDADAEKAVVLLKKNVEKRDRASALQLAQWYMEGEKVAHDGQQAVSCLCLVTDSCSEDVLFKQGIAALEQLHAEKNSKATRQLVKVFFSKKTFYKRGLNLLLDACHTFRDDSTEIILDLLAQDVQRRLESLAKNDRFAQVVRGLVFFDKAEKISDATWSLALKKKAAKCIDPSFEQLQIQDGSVQESCNNALREYFFRQGQFYLQQGDIASIEQYAKWARSLGDNRLSFACGKFLTTFKQTEENYKKGISYLVQELDNAMRVEAALLLVKFLDYFPTWCKELEVPIDKIVGLLKEARPDSVRDDFFRQFCIANITEGTEKEELFNLMDIQKQHAERLSQNDTDALYVMGLSYYLSKEFTKAYEYFDQAARQGDIYASGFKGLLLYLGEGIQQDKSTGIYLLEQFMATNDKFCSFEKAYVNERIHNRLFELAKNNKDLIAGYFNLRFYIDAYAISKEPSALNALLKWYAESIAEVNKLEDNGERQELYKKYVALLKKLEVYRNISPNVSLNFATTYLDAAKNNRDIPDEPFDKCAYLEKAFENMQKVFAMCKKKNSRLESIMFEIYEKLLFEYKESQAKGNIKKLINEMQKISFDPKSKIVYCIVIACLNEFTDDKQRENQAMKKLVDLASNGNPYSCLLLSHNLKNIPDNLLLKLAYFETAMDNTDDDVWDLIESKKVPEALINEFEVLEKDGKTASFNPESKLALNIIFARFYAGLIKRHLKDIEKIKQLKTELDKYLQPLLDSNEQIIKQAQNEAKFVKMITNWRLQEKKKEFIGRFIISAAELITDCTVPVEKDGSFKFPTVQQSIEEIYSDLQTLCIDESTNYSKEEIESLKMSLNLFKDCLDLRGVILQTNPRKELISNNNNE